MSAEDETKATEPPKEEETKKEEAAEPSATEEESNAQFEPVVKLEEVEVKSGEEEEEVVFSMRAKLFLYGESLLEKGTGNKTWNERGIGEVRILRHREHQRVRTLMRQEKTMKVICNFVIDPRIQMQPNVGSDRSWVFSAFDFAEGELVETTFAIRFANSDIANEFKEKFEECQKEMDGLLAGEDKPDEGGAADEAAEALASLSTKEDETKDKEEEKAE